MKKEILKIAGVKSEKEFYKKFPTEEAFMAKHGKAFDKMMGGGTIQDRGQQKKLEQLTDWSNMPKAQGGDWLIPAVGLAAQGAVSIKEGMDKKRGDMAKYGADIEPFVYNGYNDTRGNWKDPGLKKKWAAAAGMQLYTQSTMQNGGGVDANYNEMGGVTSMTPLPGQFYPNGMDMYPLPGKAMAGMMMQAGGQPRNANGDADGEMARGQIRAMHQYLDRLEDSIGEEDNLEPWVNSKITLADDYLGTVADYLGYSEGGEEMEEGQEMEAGGIPQRYRKMGFNRIGQKKTGSGKHKWKVLAKKGDQYKVVQGGWRGMQDYSQHGSEKRKDKFWSRMGGRNSSKAKDPFSPLYWHKRFGTWEAGGPFFELGGVNSMTQPLAGQVDMDGKELKPLAGQFDNSMSDITPLPGYAKSGIRIAPEKKGTFTAAATKHGMGVQAFAKHVLANPEKYSGLMRKKANFARNAAKWKKAAGGEIDIDFAYKMTDGGNIPDNAGFKALPESVQQKIIANMESGGKMPDNPGFKALPGYVQAKIMANMASGGKMPAEYARARFAAAGNEHLLEDYGYEAGGKMPRAIAEARFRAAGNEHLLADYGYAQAGVGLPKASDFGSYDAYLSALKGAQEAQASQSPFTQGPQLNLNMGANPAYMQNVSGETVTRPMATPGLQTVEPRKQRDLSMQAAVAPSMGSRPTSLNVQPDPKPQQEKTDWVTPALATVGALTAQLTQEPEPRRYDRPEDQAYYNPYPAGTGSGALFEHGGWIDETNGVAYPYESGVTFRAGGEMIKRADGSYSRRGLWDNIRANKGSGKKPTKEMLKQERKIKAAEKKMAGGSAAENFGEDKDMDYGYRYNDPNAARSGEFPMGFAAGGQMIKRADGSYSRRGLWDNIRANKGSGKKPTAEMLRQERKIRAAEAEAGMDITGLYYPRGGEIMNVASPAFPIARMGGNLRMNEGVSEYEEGGELSLYDDTQGAQPISENPYTSQMVQFDGERHGERNDIGSEGIPINYGGVDVEVEDGETGFKDAQGNFQILGNMKNPMTGRKFKEDGKKVAKAENKATKKIQKGLELVNEADPDNPFDALKLQSGLAKMQGGDEELKNLAALREVITELQQNKLDIADSLGIEPMDMEEQAKYGMMMKAQRGRRIPFSPMTGTNSDINMLGSDVIYGMDARPNYEFPFNTGLGNLNIDVTFPPATTTTTPPKKPGTSTKKPGAKKPAASAVPAMTPYPKYTPAGLKGAQKPSYLDYTGTGTSQDMQLPNDLNLPSDTEPFDYTNVIPELYALATNQVSPVYMQKVTPELQQAYNISMQNQLNKNNATFRAASREIGDNPGAQSILAAQKYAADQDVLEKETIFNQQLANNVYNANRQAIYDARLKNIAMNQQQAQMQEQARVNTNRRAFDALSSIVDKKLMDKATKRTLKVMENMYKFRFGKDFVARSYNPAEQWEGQYNVVGADDKGIVQNPDKILDDKTKTQKKSATDKKYGGNITKQFKSFK